MPEQEVLADLLKNPKKKTEVDPTKMLALLLANKALSFASESGAFQDEEGNPDFKKAIPTIPWVT